jgi:hypothetical protein
MDENFLVTTGTLVKKWERVWNTFRKSDYVHNPVKTSNEALPNECTLNQLQIQIVGSWHLS